MQISQKKSIIPDPSECYDILKGGKCRTNKVYAIDLVSDNFSASKVPSNIKQMIKRLG